MRGQSVGIGYMVLKGCEVLKPVNGDGKTNKKLKGTKNTKNVEWKSTELVQC